MVPPLQFFYDYDFKSCFFTFIPQSIGLIRAPFYILLLTSMLLATVARGQHPFYYTLNNDNGLPSNEVYQLYQDSFGYMWIGCNAGLFRYDGFRYTPFKNAEQNSVAISGLRVAPSQRLYCENFTGQLFYVRDDSLIMFADVKDRIRTHPAYTFDPEGSMWMGLPGGIVVKDTAGKETTVLREEIYANDIIQGADGAIYAVGGGLGLMRIVRQPNGSYKGLKMHGAEEAFLNSRSTLERHGQRLFSLSSSNISGNYYITEIMADTAIMLKKIPANTIAEFIYSLTFIDGKLWIGTSAGAFRLTVNGVIEKQLFPSEKISDIITDREGNYWFSSLQSGIFVVPDMQLRSFTTSNSSLKDHNITALRAVSPEKLLIGTYSGNLYSYSLTNDQLHQFPRSNKAVYRNVTSMILHDSTHIIVSRGAVSVIDIARNTDHSYPSVYIRDMAILGDSLFFASSEAIGILGNLNDLVFRNKYNYSRLKDLGGRFVCVDKSSGTLWVSFNDMLATLEQGKFLPFTINGLPVYCNALHSDDKGIWIGTVSGDVYNIRNKQIKTHLNSKNGLRGGNVRCIISIQDTLYVATDACINICYPNGRFAYVDNTDGINAREISALSVVDGNLFVGTIRGLFQVPVASVFTNKVPPCVRISSVAANGKTCDPSQTVTLPWNKTEMAITFSAVALKSRGQFDYLYRIRGFHDDWQRLDGSVNYVRISHLPPGEFTFEVRAVNEDGTYSATTASLGIIAEAPLWQKWWFYSLIFLFGSALVTLLFVWRIRKIKRESRIRNQVAESQLTALKAQMNPHFMYNTLNSIQDLILQNDIRNTNYYLGRYSMLMRKILEVSENNEIELAEEVEILELYMELEKLRFGNDFTWSIELPGIPEDSHILIPSMIIQPFVENAIKHGLLHKKGEKLLRINFALLGAQLVCRIVDNGIGRARAAEIRLRSGLSHRPFATRATERRLGLVNLGRKHKIRLEIIDLQAGGNATGTEVVITIPLT